MSTSLGRHVISALVVSAIAMLSIGSGAADAQTPPTFGISRTHFTVNSTPKFLTFFSYFAALRPTGSVWGATLTPTQKANHLAEVDSHFGMLKAMGFDGVRIFPNWAWSFTVVNSCDVPDANTLMKPAAGASLPSPIPGKPNTTWLNTQQLDMLHQVLTKAGQKQLIVEVAWNNEQVRSINPANNAVLDRLTPAEYQLAMSEVVTQLSGLHPHMFYDVQNEYNYGVASTTCPKDAYTGAGIGTFLPTLRSIDQARKFTASFTQPAGPPPPPYHVPVTDAYNGTFDIVAYHDPRNYTGTAANWPTQTVSNVNGLRASVETQGPSAVWKPVLFSEPDRWLCCSSPQSSLSATNFRTAVANAKLAGAAGWTFHNEAFFRNASIPLVGGIPASVAPGFSFGGPEWDFMNTFSAHIAPVTWGIPRLAGVLDTPAPGATVRQSFTASGWVIDRAAANAAATSVTFYGSNSINVPQVFLGSATVTARPDVAGAYGAEYLNSGFAANLFFPAVGSYYLVVVVLDSVNGTTYPFSIPLNIIP